MRKKADPLVLLSVLVVSGVILSHFVIFSQADKQPDYSAISQKTVNDRAVITTFNSQLAENHQLVRIDPLKQQTH
jgi:hypothetical protein